MLFGQSPTVHYTLFLGTRGPERIVSFVQKFLYCNIYH